ncbi:MAG TPA: hypothetical protein VKZ63_21475 [Kofleriaceae bacterium]|nr:hypothetical protein [Kofleriaceae bacterium]
MPRTNRVVCALALLLATACGGASEQTNQPAAAEASSAPAPGAAGSPSAAGDHLVLSDASITIDLGAEQGELPRELRISAAGEIAADGTPVASLSRAGEVSVDGRVKARLAESGEVTFADGQAEPIVIAADGTIELEQKTAVAWGEDGALGGAFGEMLAPYGTVTFQGAPEMRRPMSLVFVTVFLVRESGPQGAAPPAAP